MSKQTRYPRRRTPLSQLVRGYRIHVMSTRFNRFIAAKPIRKTRPIWIGDKPILPA
jgi:hypothetical protein